MSASPQPQPLPLPRAECREPMPQPLPLPRAECREPLPCAERREPRAECREPMPQPLPLPLPRAERREPLPLPMPTPRAECRAPKPKPMPMPRAESREPMPLPTPRAERREPTAQPLPLPLPLPLPRAECPDPKPKPRAECREPTPLPRPLPLPLPLPRAERRVPLPHAAVLRGSRGMRMVAKICAALVVVLASATAAADPITVKVVDVAGGAVYLTPGRAAGIVPGTKVRLRGVDAVVVEVTEKTSVVRLDGARIAIGDAGTADVTPGATAPTRPLAKPRPPDAFAGQWSDPVLPASQQTPKTVPLGAARGPNSAHVTVIGHAFGAADHARSTASAEGRVIATFDLMTDRPLAADLDVAGRWFRDGFDGRTHTPVLVRAAQLRYGELDDPRLAVGRLRFAAASVGMLDGGRASARVGSLELAAFGGLVPDPLSGKPETSASRFGAEVAYDAPEAPWQPRLAVTAHGSTWNGQLDERRLAVTASASAPGAAADDRGALWLDGWAELAQFPAGNLWGAPALELAGAGATAEWRKRGTHAGLDVTFLRPERSLRLAAALPPEWLCSLVATAPAPDRCASGDWWGSATASLGTRTPRWAIDAVGTLGNSHGQFRGLDRSGYLRGELRTGAARLAAGVAAGQASFARWTAGEVGVGYAAAHVLDIALAYRPALLDYVASTKPQLVHSVVADARIALSTALDLALSALGSIGSSGADRDALALLALFVWRPLP